MAIRPLSSDSAADRRKGKRDNHRQRQFDSVVDEGEEEVLPELFMQGRLEASRSKDAAGGSGEKRDAARFHCYVGAGPHRDPGCWACASAGASFTPSPASHSQTLLLIL